MGNGIDIRLTAGGGITIPFLNTNASARITMSRNQQAQQPPIKNPELRIIDTGYATQLSKFTYDIRVEHDTMFFKVIKRFNNRDDEWSNQDWSSMLLLGYDLETNELVHYELPRYRILGSKFGMPYKVDEYYVTSLMPGDIIPAGRRLAWNQSNDDDVFKNGRNLNTAIISLPDVGEDCIMMCEDVLKHYNIKMYEDHEVSYGKTSILADVHKNADGTRKALPDVGDKLKAGDLLYSSVDLDVKALKKEDWSIINNAILYSKKGLSTKRPHFTNHNILRYNCKVVDMNVIYNPKSGETVESDSTASQTASYLMMLKTYHREIIATYDLFKKQYPDGYVNVDTANLLINSMVFIEKPIRGKEPKVTRKKKRNALDIYTAQITTEYDITPTAGFKFSNFYGGLIY